jgi:transcriptional regulator GlxA family with amidase domain
MSLCTPSRWCREHFGDSPAELVRRLRLVEARWLPEETTMSLKNVASRAGVGRPK